MLPGIHSLIYRERKVKVINQGIGTEPLRIFQSDIFKSTSFLSFNFIMSLTITGIAGVRFFKTPYVFGVGNRHLGSLTVCLLESKNQHFMKKKFEWSGLSCRVKNKIQKMLILVYEAIVQAHVHTSVLCNYFSIFSTRCGIVHDPILADFYSYT